jgi:hypothetical protein
MVENATDENANEDTVDITDHVVNESDDGASNDADGSRKRKICPSNSDDEDGSGRSSPSPMK